MVNKVLINAGNLHAGGGVQVATSFITELASIEILDFELLILVSSEVLEGLRGSGFDNQDSLKIKCLDIYGLKALFSKINKDTADFSLIFTIFGPNYLQKKGYIDLVGFAQPWILDQTAYQVLSPISRFKTRIKFFLQKWFFKNADNLVVELEHVRDGLYRKKIASPGTVHVSYNCISSLYLDDSRWQPVRIQEQTANFRVGFLGRDYPHKNTDIISQVKKVLHDTHGLDVEFFVTLNDSEWSRKSSEFKRSVNNVGSLKVTECPSFYQAMDAIIFPSLLECFSATPLESMAMERPLFASDRRFVKDICNDHVFYFDPFDSADAARVIAHYIQNYHGKDSLRLQQAREQAISFSSARGRAEQYLEIIRDLLAEKIRKDD